MDVIKKLILILVSSFFDMIIIAIIISLIGAILLGYSQCTYIQSGYEYGNFEESIIPCIIALVIYSVICIPIRYFLIKCTLKISFSKCVLPIFILLVAITALPLILDGIFIIWGVLIFNSIYSEAIALNGAYMPFDSFEPLSAYIPLLIGISGANLRVQLLFYLIRDKKEN